MLTALSKQGYDASKSLRELQETSKIQLAVADRTINGIQATNAALRGIGDTIQDQGIAQTASSQTMLQMLDRIDRIDEQTRRLDPMSSQQAEAFLAKFEQLQLGLQEQLQTRHAVLLDHGTQTLAEDLNQCNEPVKAMKAIENTISHLSCYADTVEKTLHNEEADSVLQDLDKILELLLESQEERSLAKRKQRLVDSEDQPSPREMRLLRKRVSASESAVINSSGNPLSCFSTSVPN